MTGFDPAWLDLREPADARARAPELLARVAALFRSDDVASVADLGCGTGSLLRALAPLLPERQRWLLVDGDLATLRAAPARLADWADSANWSEDSELRLIRAGKRIDVTFRQIDLAESPLPLDPGEAGLVAASALFDLVSAEWLARFCDALAAYGAPLYAALSYDGAMAWSPAQGDDARAEALFNRHQTRDKGTGAALGPRATAALAQSLAVRGYRTETADSPWRLGPDASDLIRATRAGVANALKEIEPADWIDAWRDAPCSGAVIGHADVFASVG